MLRARRIRNFLSQPFFVAEKFSGKPGKYVKRDDTVRSFKEILDGKYDSYPEEFFIYVGSIDEVKANYENYLKANTTEIEKAKA